jgi:serine/threonine protein kinase/Tol biopolymer transport system component
VTLAAGTRLGRYEIRSKLGEGGMGEVYLAQDTKLDRTVALKVLPADLANDQSRMRRFAQEARTASSLSHPNVAHIYEIEEIEGVHFIAMEYIEGETLRERVARAPVDLNEILEISIQIAAALAAAHASAITHRDIKPDNVMLRHDGYVKVLDFGLAKLSEPPAVAGGPNVEAEALTRARVKTDPGTVMGTVGYMSPEQARGQPVDPRTDIWSLGVVIFQMISLHLPFEGSSNSDVIAAILGKEPPPLARYARDVPESLEWIVTKALTKDRDERYQSAKELSVDLRRVKQRLEAQAEIQRSSSPDSTHVTSSSPEAATMIAARGISTSAKQTSTAPAISSAEFIVKEIKRHRVAIAAMFVVVLGAVAGAGLLVYKAARSREPAPAAPKFTRLTSGGKIGNEEIEGGVAISADGKYVVFATGDTAGRSSYYVRQVATNSLVKIAGPMESFNASGTTFSPDGDYIYFPNIDQANPDGALYRVPVFGGTPQKILEGIWSSITFSPDEKQIAYVRLFPATGESWLVIANADGSGAPQTIARHKLPDYYSTDGPSWSPDGAKIVVGLSSIPEIDNATLVEVAVKTGSERAITKPQWSEIRRVLWLKDGSGLVFTATSTFFSFSTQVWQVSYPAGVVRRITNDLNGYGSISLGLTADDQTIATVQDDMTRNIFVATPGQDSARQISNGKHEGSFSLDTTPDGRIVFVDDTGKGLEIWSMKLDGSDRKQLTSDGAIKISAAVTPDGRYIIFNSNRSGAFAIWRMDLDGNNQKQLTQNERFAYAAAASTDGNWVVYTGLRGGNWVLLKVSIDGGESTQVSDRQCGNPGISPDGKLIACISPDERASFRWQAAIIPFDGGATTKLLDLPPGFSITADLQWTPDGKSIVYVASTNNVGNIYSQPIDGGPPKALTSFKADFIDAFNWTHDKKQLIFGHGGHVEDVVLIKDFR